MNVRSSRAVPTAITTGLMAASLLTATAVPAAAGSTYSYRANGRAVSASWMQIDAGPDATPGNAHLGYLGAEESTRGTAYVWGYIQDFDCPDGVLPTHGHGGHGEDEEPAPEPTCEHVGVRWIDGANLTFSMDKKLNTAKLVGNVTVSDGHGSGPTGTPGVNMTWTGTGDTFTSSYTTRWREGGSSGSDSYRSTSRNAVVSGSLGPMGFDPDRSSGFLDDYQMAYRSRTR